MALNDIMFFKDDEYNVVIKQNLVTPEDGEIKEVRVLYRGCADNIPDVLAREARIQALAVDYGDLEIVIQDAYVYTDLEWSTQEARR